MTWGQTSLGWRQANQLVSLPSLQPQGSYGEMHLSWAIGTAWKEKEKSQTGQPKGANI